MNKLLERVSKGHTIVAMEVLRITRSTKQLCEIVEIVKKKHLKLAIGGCIVDCSKSELDALTGGMLKTMAVFAEMERNMISERVKSEMANAIARGKLVSRPNTTVESLPSHFIKHYPKYKTNQINKAELARLCNISRQSIYKYIKMYEQDKRYWGKIQ